MYCLGFDDIPETVGFDNMMPGLTISVYQYGIAVVRHENTITLRRIKKKGTPRVW